MSSSFAFLVLGVLCWQLQSSASSAASSARGAATWGGLRYPPSSRIETGVLSGPNGSNGSADEGSWELEEIRRLAKPGGMYTNTLLVGEDKSPLVFHFDPTNRTLWAVFCLDAMCEKTSSAKVGKGGRSNAALLGADGLPFVAFCQAGSNDEDTPSRLMGFKCSTPSCSSNDRDDGYALGTETVLDSDGCDLYTAAAANDDDLPVIAYYRKGGPGSVSGPSTWIAVCLDTHCHESRRNPLQTQDHGNVNGPYAGVVVHAGLPVVSVAWRKVWQPAWSFPMRKYLNYKTLIITFCKQDGAEIHSSMPALFFCSDALCKDPVTSSNIKILAPANAPPIDDGSEDVMDVRYTAMSSRLTDIYVLYFDALSGKAIIATVMDATLIKQANFADAPEARVNRIETAEVDSNIGDVYGEFPHIAPDPLDNGYPAMAYTRQVSQSRGDLMLVTCKNRDCTRRSRERLAKGKCGFGRDTSMAFNLQEGKAYVSFMDYNSKGSKRSANIAILTRPASRVTSYTAGKKHAEYDDRRFAAFKDIC